MCEWQYVIKNKSILFPSSGKKEIHLCSKCMWFWFNYYELDLKSILATCDETKNYFEEKCCKNE